MHSPKSGQAAMEFMIIVIIAILFVTPLWYYSMQTRNDVTSEMSLSYAKNAAKKISETASLLNSQREGARAKLEIYMPDGIIYANVSDGYVMMGVRTAAGTTDIVEQTRANLSGTVPISKGTHYLVMQAMEDYVSIEETS